MVAKLAVVDPPRKQRKPMTGTVLRLKQMMSSVARPQSFTIPEFPPGIAPKKARMAMDDAFGAVNAWGNQSAFVASAAVNYASAALEGLAFPGYAFLAELAQRPEYRRISEIIATEMTRKWIKITSTGKDDDSKIEQIKIIESELKRLNVRDCFQKCTELDGYFGRAHLYIDTGFVDDREELKTPIGDGSNEVSMRKMVGKNINYIQHVEPVWTYPTSYNSIDPLKQDWYEPNTWFVLGKEIHKTRLLKFVGREVPDMLKPAYSFGGLSMSQMAIPYVNNWLRTRQSVADIIHSFSVFVLKTDLSESLSEGGEELFQRAEAFNMFRDNKGVFLLDKDGEDFANVSAPLGSLDHLQAQTQEHMSSVSGIPLVKLTGISPSGLNATSEFEMRAFYDWVNAFQEKLFRPNLTIVINMIQLSKIGKIDSDITFTFEPLWALDEKGQAEVNQIKSQSGIAMVEAGILSQEEERKRVATDPSSDYSSIDVEDVPDLRQEEEQGLEPHGGAAKIAQGAAEQQGEVDPVGQGEGSEDEEGQDDEPFAAGELRPDYIAEEAYERDAQPDHPGRGSPRNRKIAEAALKLRDKPGYKGELHDDYLEGKNPLPGTLLKERAALRKEATDDEPMPMVRERKMNPKFLEGKHQTDPNYLKRRSQQRDEAAFDSEFKESEHPRDADGKFGSGGGSSGGSRPFGKSHATLDMGGMKKVGKQLGSNPGGKYEDENGTRYYIKKGKTPEHAKNENLAGALYNLAGVQTQKYYPVKGGGYIATEWQDFDKDNAKDFTEKERKEAAKDFAVHAWLANWDAAGLDYDNQAIIGGKPASIDLGGAMLYRAQGAPKGDKFGNSVGEWNSLRDPNINHQNAQLFKGMSQEDLKESAEKVTSIPDEDIRKMVEAYEMPDSLADKLIARKKDIAKRVGVQAHDEWHPFIGLGMDESNFKESEHPRDSDGKFAAYQHSISGEVGKKLKENLKELEFKKAPKTSSGKFKYENPDGAVIVVEPPPEKGAWSANWTLYPYANHPSPIKGKGNKSLSEALGQMTKYNTKESIPLPPPLPNAEQKNESKQPNMLESKGYELAGNGIWKKGESKIKFDPNAEYGNEKWISISPGHVAKEGEGLKSLEMLLSGESVKNANVANVPNADFESWPAEKPKPQAPEPPKQKPLSEPAVNKWEGHEKLKELSKNQPTPTSQQKSAMSIYIGNGYDHMNSQLRHGSGVISGHAKHLQDFITKCEIPEPITVWRTVKGEYAKILKSILVDGTKFQDKGFSSTTVDPGFNFKAGEGAFKFEISVPKGAKGAHVDNFGESEIVFKAGCKYKVLEFDENYKTPYGQWFAKLEMLLE